MDAFSYVFWFLKKSWFLKRLQEIKLAIFSRQTEQYITENSTLRFFKWPRKIHERFTISRTFSKSRRGLLKRKLNHIVMNYSFRVQFKGKIKFGMKNEVYEGGEG